MTPRICSRPTLGIVALACALAGDPRLLHGQEASCSVGTASVCSIDLMVRMTTTSVISLSLSERGVVLPTPLMTGGERAVAVQGPTAVVSANTDWQLLVAAAATTWQTAFRGAVAKPASDLLWSLSASGPFVPLSQVPALLATGSANARVSIPTYLRALFDVTTDEPGQYVITVNYTIVAP